MKNIGKLAVLGAVLTASASFAMADTITLGSYGATTVYNPGTITVANTAVLYTANQTFANDTTGCAVNTFCLPAPSLTNLAAPVVATDLNPSNVWAAALGNSSWVGINGTAGPVNTSNPKYGYYAFTTTVNGLLDNYNGTLSLMADDTTAVYLTNSAGINQLVLSAGTLGGDAHCADTAPSCLTTDTANLDLLAGNNTLTFIVRQAGVGPTGGTADPSGLDFSANLSETPEPSSLMLLGTGLVGAAGAFLRKRATV